MVQLTSIINFLDSLLEAQHYNDIALNGLQVQSSNKVVQKAAFAVDAGRSVLQAAIDQDADLLVVHHGIFWGQLEPITGTFGAKIDLLLRSKCSLYASHLPLDGHKEVGNAFELGRSISLEDLSGFCEYKGTTIGASGRFAKPRDISSVAEELADIPGAIPPVLLAFGPSKITTVGIVTGSGSTAIPICKDQGIDLLISGEAKHEAYHLAQDLAVNALFIGHYASETFGVRALQQRLERDFEIETTFIDEPSGI